MKEPPMMPSCSCESLRISLSAGPSSGCRAESIAGVNTTAEGKNTGRITHWAPCRKASRTNAPADEKFRAIAPTCARICIAETRIRAM
ncbi:MAG: hypothetical protein ABFD82_06620 [Syntrophaceae bacterium]